MKHQSANSHKKDLLYPELSYKIIGSAFEVHNLIGGAQTEKVYQNAFAKELELNKIPYEREVYCPVEFKGTIVGKGFIDFLIEGKVVVETKRGSRVSQQHIRQIMKYLDAKKLDLAILIHFHDDQVKFKRFIRKGAVTDNSVISEELVH